MPRISFPDNPEIVFDHYRRDIYGLSISYGSELVGALAWVAVVIGDRERWVYPAAVVVISHLLATLARINLKDNEQSVVDAIHGRKVELSDQSELFLRLGTILAETQELQSLLRAARRRKNR